VKENTKTNMLLILLNLLTLLF